MVDIAGLAAADIDTISCAAMPEYRAYIIDQDGHIKRFEPLVCDDNVSAVATAKRLVDGHDVEVWQGARKVTMLVHKDGPKWRPRVAPTGTEPNGALPVIPTWNGDLNNRAGSEQRRSMP